MISVQHVHVIVHFIYVFHYSTDVLAGFSKFCLPTKWQIYSHTDNFAHNWRLLCKKGIDHFLGWFSLFQDRANFWQTDLFWHEKHRSVIFLLICALFSRNNICKKISFPRVSFGDLLLNKKQKKPFVLLNDEVTKVWHLPLVVRTDTSFIINVITLFSYFLLLHKQIRHWTGWSQVCFVVTPVQYQVGRFFFSGLFLYFFQK